MMKDIRTLFDKISKISEDQVKVEFFNKNDVLDLRKWGKHEDLRYSQYDFSMFPNSETFNRWYKIKTNGGKMLFAIKYKGVVRGFISLREVDLIKGNSVMGIAIDPNFTSLGLGTVALKRFLGIYFEKMKMRILDLKVSDFNVRAKRLYERVGFIFQKRQYEDFENQMNNFHLLLMYEDFKMEGDTLYTIVSSYRLTADKYNANLESE